MTDAGKERVELLVEQARGGDRQAFSVLTRQMMKQVAALTYRITGERESALDLAQETFVSAWENLPTFRGEAVFSSWLYRIATNKALNYMKSSAVTTRADAVEPDEMYSPEVSPEVELERKHLAEDILVFMHGLPEQQKVIFNLRFYQELSFEEIAQTTGRALGTVKTNYREAVKKLRQYAVEKGWRS